jgi:hypothetical protein
MATSAPVCLDMTDGSFVGLEKFDKLGAYESNTAFFPRLRLFP